MNFPKISSTFAPLAAIILITSLFVACGDDGESTKAKDTPSLGENEVETFDDLPNCTIKREGDTYYVVEDETDYLCEDGRWIDDSKQGKSSSSKKGAGSSSTKSGDKESSNSKTKDDDKSSSSSASVPRDTVLRNASIMGSATKGPFKFGSPVVIYELDPDNLRERTGVSYKDEVSSNQGHYVIPKVTLVSPYAELTVEGAFLSEVTGKNTSKNFELRSIANRADSSESNINLLTHLEANRILALMEKGYTFAAAKKQAEQEVMTSFNLANTVAAEHSTIYNNATLMAISLLFLGDRTEAEIQKAIDNYIADLEKDGQWNDSITKAQMADWAYETNWLNIHKNVDAWNIVNIANFHDEVLKYRDNMWGLGGCTNNRNKELATVTNKESKYLHQCFSCGIRQASDQWISDPYTWHKEKQIKCDTQDWAKGKDGDVKKGSVDESNYYVYDDDAWREADSLDVVLNVGCTEKSLGTYNTKKFVCDADGWRDAKSTEIDLQKGCIAATEGQTANSKDVELTCVDGMWSALCDGIEYNPTEQFCLDKTIMEKCYGKTYAQEQFCYKEYYVVNRCGEKSYNLYEEYCNEGELITKGTLIDSRDGKKYKTVTIGTQIWMAENLNYDDSVSTPNLVRGSRCYDENCETYGRLYTWVAAMNLEPVYISKEAGDLIQAKHQGICPEGWHIPTGTEWNRLQSYVDGLDDVDDNEGYWLKAQYGWSDYEERYGYDYVVKSGNGIDGVGFSALPVGWHYAEFWTTFESGDLANCRLLRSDCSYLNWDPYDKYVYQSVRCIKD